MLWSIWLERNQRASPTANAQEVAIIVQFKVISWDLIMVNYRCECFRPLALLGEGEKGSGIMF